MKPLSHYIDKFITAFYIASLIGGVLVCLPKDEGVPVENMLAVNMRFVASVGSDLDYMTADDFLIPGEKAADKEDITDYLDDLKKNGSLSTENQEN